MKKAPIHFKVTKTNRVGVTDLVPHDTLEDKEQNSGTIEDVEGKTKNGLLTWRILLTSQQINTYIFKLIKA